MRIVSLVPSQTELLYYLNLEQEVVGITKFCIHPQEWYQNKMRVGGTKNVNIEQVLALKPTLILANKEENVKEQVTALSMIAPTFVSDIDTFEDALKMIVQVSDFTGKSDKGSELIETIKFNFNQLAILSTPLKVLYFIWKDPYMVVGNNNFIHDMIEKIGFKNTVAHLNRYPQIEKQEIIDYQPDLVFLSSEPYPFKQKEKEELQQMLPNATIMLVDGEMFSWYGSRMLLAPAYFATLINDIRNKF